MNTYCQIQRGFFIQRSCGRKGTLQCEKCQRPICIAHQAISELPRILCVECAPAAIERNEDQTWEDDNTTSVRYRSHYRDQGYSPLLWHVGIANAAGGDPLAGSFPSSDESDFDTAEGDGLFEDGDLDGDGDVSAFDS